MSLFPVFNNKQTKMIKKTYADSPFHRLKKSVTDISADTEHFVKNIGNCNISCCGAVPTLKKKINWKIIINWQRFRKFLH